MATLFPPANSSLPTQVSPLSILEAFIPSYLSPLISYFGLNNAVPHILTFLVISTAAATGWTYWYDQFACLFRRFFMSTAQIRSRDELYEHMMAWVAEQEFSARTRYFVATMAFGSLFAESAGESEEEESQEPDAPYWERNRRAPLQFTPAPGLHFFKYKGKIVMLERIVDNSDKAWFPQEILEFSIMGREPQLLKEILKEAREKYLMKDKSKTVVHRPKGPTEVGSPPTWVRCLARPSRPLSTVVLEQKQKEMFVDDIKDYLEPDTQKWYSDRGIPYRRGYLLHGPPGTGKSSLSFAAAGLLGLKIYDTSTEVDTRVSLSGLLNVIDGVASPEGRVLILTTNHPEKLDAALIRPGRVDMKIEFKLAGEEAIAGLFMRIQRRRKEAKRVAEERAVKEKRLLELVAKFAQIMPQEVFSPAEIQGYLLQHKNQPERAVECAEKWVCDRMEARKAGKID
ncbi:BCS1 N terminal-domain-containing protein [Tuber borchii]|uniref:BCS1 N terminal-domain-containing protein n=1 Tax=Tuber borchii TaxID=42251 RepID=A0A2T6ZR23_TUBBO|nr:BCS1 N terminal-domain-containing protein [Tuber borchii]